MDVKNIFVESYQPKWKDDFKKIAIEVEEVLTGLILRIEHVGSTSVNGLAAKPIIDMDIVIKDYTAFEEVIERLHSIGYIYEGDLGIKDRRAFMYEGKTHLQKHHIYVCPEYSNELHRHIAFRDYLRLHPKAVQEYGEIKMEAAKLYPHDIEKYLKYKGVFISQIYSELGL